jgi:hypothetical protein
MADLGRHRLHDAVGVNGSFPIRLLKTCNSGFGQLWPRVNGRGHFALRFHKSDSDG